MRKIIDAKSKAEKRNTSRLPEFDADWKIIVKGEVIQLCDKFTKTKSDIEL